jgi:RHS repeat-associated protein
MVAAGSHDTSQFSWNLGYDNADQLGSVTVQGSMPVPIEGNVSYFYDKVSNLVQATSSLVTLNASYNSLNQLIQLRGTVGGASLSDSLTYDADGNLTRQSASLSLGDGDNGANNVELSGPRTYQWDGVNRLTSVGYVPPGSNNVLGTTEFTYDGLDRLVRIIEKTGQTITGDRRFVWCGLAICQERDSQENVVKRFFAQGLQVEAASVGSPRGQYYYGRDHLGSIRSLTDGTGGVRAVYEYDAYGVRQRVTGDVSADFGFTGLLYHGRSHLCLALYRAYDPVLKRWLSRDPAVEGGGPSLYAYTDNNPTDEIDPLGLCGNDNSGAAASGLGIGLGAAMVDTGDKRAAYNNAVAKLDPADSAGRKAATAQAVAEQTMLGKSIGTAYNRSRGGGGAGFGGGRANVANTNINTLGTVFRVAGKGMVLVALSYDAYRVETSNCPGRELFQIGFGILGGLGGGTSGAFVGSAVPVAGTIALGVAGSTAGGLAGENAGGAIYDQFFGN